MGSTIETSATVELKASLVRARNADGGWGYFAGKSSRLEPTCWALLAIGDEASADVLKQWPSENGLLLERAGGTPNFGFHGLALLALFGRKIVVAQLRVDHGEDRRFGSRYRGRLDRVQVGRGGRHGRFRRRHGR